MQLTSSAKYLRIQNEKLLDNLYDPEVGEKWLVDT
jgi:hypothetical protein